MDVYFSDFIRIVIFVLYVLLIVLAIRYIVRKLLHKYHSNWNTLIDEFTYSSKDFYGLIKKELLSNGINNLNVKFVFHKEGNIFSSKRTYLRATWKEYQYDICAAPFGKGFFISWWLLYKNSILQIIVSRIPFIGVWLNHFLFPITYYKVDTASMFMSYCQQAVLNVIDHITADKGIREITAEERKPILNNIFKR